MHFLRKKIVTIIIYIKKILQNSIFWVISKRLFPLLCCMVGNVVFGDFIFT
jgi:hypothetical protein